MINRGGLVAYGGMIGGFLSCVYGCRKRGIPLLQWADVSAPSVVLGTAITRIGCFLFGCDYGARSNLPWAVRFPGPNPLAPNGSPAWQHHVQDSRPVARGARRSYPVHPTQIYESLVGLSLFALLMLIRRYRRFSGQVFLGWVLGYGILRPLIEIVRDDDDRGLVRSRSRPRAALDLADHRPRLGRARARPARRAGAPLPARSGEPCDSGWRPQVAPAGGPHGRTSNEGGGKRRKRR